MNRQEGQYNPEQEEAQTEAETVGVAQRQWLELADSIGLDEKTAEDTFEVIQENYSSPDRKYHNLRHVLFVLNSIDEVGEDSGIQNLDSLRLAAWFHDIVYDPRSNNNEGQSALLMREVLGTHLPTESIDNVATTILATRSHEPINSEGQILLDADLAILGSSEEDYDKYAAQIREEYAHVSDGDYRWGRIKVLTNFLEKPIIYQTPYFKQFERRARQNIAREIEILR